jgi:hypothetical protein
MNGMSTWKQTVMQMNHTSQNKMVHLPSNGKILRRNYQSGNTVNLQICFILINLHCTVTTHTAYIIITFKVNIKVQIPLRPFPLDLEGTFRLFIFEFPRSYHLFRWYWQANSGDGLPFLPLFSPCLSIQWCLQLHTILVIIPQILVFLSHAWGSHTSLFEISEFW